MAESRRYLEIRGWLAVAWAAVMSGLYVQMIARARWDALSRLAGRLLSS